ncbi:G-type lectin S-receptor-like serine/threonine-protein kinase SD2-2 [Arachis hypogaea]|uniref:G-type lectin S-receptor-like serine/threonine-protein kinase SD2-2 n=1 Tax=Arachis hypogaea TaxID=3818 RepID=UPI000DED345B|nr:G-type lectin S-receptor-like serine/threonine-protein kinase SD2-2 [Arachis hypogaea]
MPLSYTLFFFFFLQRILTFTIATSSTTIILEGSTTLRSPNNTFELGIFNLPSSNNFYLAIRYASLSKQTLIWVANRRQPSPTQTNTTLQLTNTTTTCHLSLTHPQTSLPLWQTPTPKGPSFSSCNVQLLENGNLVLLSSENGTVLWQSFDEPTDKWLPGMNLTRTQSLVSWKTETDPSPGLYSLRLKPPDYGELELVFNGTDSYWSTGNWTGNFFTGIPEMTNPYIYRFHFEEPFTAAASFGFTETTSDSGFVPTMFRLEPHGQVQQYTWWKQAGAWNKFWFKPEVCQVRGLCGRFGVCKGHESSELCVCVDGFGPSDEVGWGNGDYTMGCVRKKMDSCDKRDGFQDMGLVKFGSGSVNFSKAKSRSFCESKCLGSCECVGLTFSEGSGLCKNFYGSVFDFQNVSSVGLGVGDGGGALYVRVPRDGNEKGLDSKVLIVAVLVGSVAVLGVVVVTLLVLVKKKRKKELEEEDRFIQMLNLRMFSYKELQLATRGFSEKVGHGGFGTVFQGELSDSTLVAVKRLERPGSGEKEFRAEVSTIGNIQHVNLVRLRGFCSENAHRLLVYEFMQNGALSAYLRREGPSLSWDVRFRVAVGTAKGIAYLHEECRNCIIHCDIKPENILLDSGFNAKVSDFGLAKLMGRDFSRVLATMRGTWGYVAPEWISGVAITAKADVYSYGMTLLELIGGRRNIETLPSAGGCDRGKESGCEMGERWFFPPWAARQIIDGNVASVIDKKLGDAYNIEEARRVSLVAVWCIQDDEAIRPTMDMVVKMLKGLVEIRDPPLPNLLQALVTGESFQGVKSDSGNEISTGGGLSGGNLEVSIADSESYVGDAFPSPMDVNVNVDVR